MSELRLFTLPGVPEVREDDDLAALLLDASRRAGKKLQAGDIVAVAQKVVSKSEGRLIRLADLTPSPRALELAAATGKDARKVEAILLESSEILRAVRFPPEGLIIARHRRGWICANAGIDESNLGPQADGMALLLPEDADDSARRLRAKLEQACPAPIGVIVTDTFGRPWRHGLVNVAIGVAGVPAIVSWKGRVDAYGRALQATLPAFADELAAAACLLMKKDGGTPFVVLRGAEWAVDEAARATDVLRPTEQELFL